MLSKQIDLILRAQAGDIEARNVLIETNLPYINYVVAACVGCKNVKQYLSDGVLGFICALETFNPSKVKNHFNAFFWACIRSKIADTRRVEGRWELHKEKVVQKVREALSLIEVTEHPDPVEWDEVWAAVGELPERERIIMTEWLAGETFKATARQLGISSQRVHQIKLGILGRLRARFAS